MNAKNLKKKYVAQFVDAVHDGNDAFALSLIEKGRIKIHSLVAVYYADSASQTGRASAPDSKFFPVLYTAVEFGGKKLPVL